MKTSKINIEDIRPSDYNPRIMPTDEMAKLTTSLRTFGLVDPIIIDLTDNNTIIGGHQRYEALQSIGAEELTLIPLGDIGLVINETNIRIKDKNDQKALNIALNKIQGEFDYNQLDILFDDLLNDGYNIELTGFTEDELKLDLDLNIDTLNTYEEQEPAPEEQYKPLKEIKTSIKKGDKYKLGRHTLQCGDSSNKEEILQLIQDNKIDLILTDPPYGMGLNTDYSDLKSKLKFFQEKNKSNPGAGTQYKQGAVDEYKPQFINNILDLNIKETFIFGANYFTKEIPILNEGSWLVWDKRSNEDQDINTVKQADKMYGSCFELCWSRKKHKQDIIRIRWAGLFGMEKEPDKQVKRIHPTQKPVKLAEHFINKYLKENNNNILDLFGGSGSTLIACETTGNNCYMMELDPYYCQIIINRWEEYTGRKAVKL